jgi:hypothetical protein
MTPGPTIKQGVAHANAVGPSENGQGSGHVVLLSHGVGGGGGVIKHGIVSFGGQGGGQTADAPPSIGGHGGQPLAASGHGSGHVGHAEAGSHGAGVGQGVMKQGIVSFGGQGGGQATDVAPAMSGQGGQSLLFVRGQGFGNVGHADPGSQGVSVGCGVMMPHSAAGPGQQVDVTPGPTIRQGVSETQVPGAEQSDGDGCGAGKPTRTQAVRSITPAAARMTAKEARAFINVYSTKRWPSVRGSRADC